MKKADWIIISFLVMSAAGCANGNACDPEMERDRNYCVEQAPDPPGGLGGMGGESTEAPEPARPSDTFGVACTLENQAEVCGGDAPDCGLQPGADAGICTVFGCQTEPESVVCPIGWSCFALADACLED